jgi:hypothetical protein
VSITKVVQPESIGMVVERSLPMSLVAEIYMILNEKQLLQSRLILATTCLSCSSLEGNAAPEYLFLNSGAQNKFQDLFASMWYY